MPRNMVTAKDTAPTADDPNEEPIEEEEEEVDDWGLECDFHLFAQHQPQTVHLPNNETFQILCVEALTPIDMSNLGSGVHDATGHCVWAGAFLLVACLDILRPWLNYKSVLELGCGTGIGGISVLKATQPTRVVLTDSDPQVLNLCKRNCELNGCVNYEIQELPWGETPKDIASYDTILATDVLYDIGLLPSLFTTAKHTAEIFILSHVPRACYNTNHPPVENLEVYIVEQAQSFGYKLLKMVRPLEGAIVDPIPKDALNNMSLQHMSDIGAAILVFQTADKR